MSNLARILIVLLGFLAAPGFAQEYPSRPVRLVIGNPPGGATDVIARVFADELARFLKHPVVVENRAGAGGLIAAQVVKNAPADGYVLYAGATQSFNATFLRENPLEAAKELRPVSMLAHGDLFVFARSELGVSSIRELVEKSKTSIIRHAGPSPGQSLLASLIGKRAGLAFDNIPYKGTEQALLGLLSGNGDFMVNSLPGMPIHIQTGKLRVLATIAPERSVSLPNVPTLKEQGVDFDQGFHLGVWAPLNTPREVVVRMGAAIAEAARAPAVVAKINGAGMRPKASSPEELLRAHIELAKAYAEAAEMTGFKP